MHYNKQLCTVWYTTASAGIAKGGCWQLCNTSVVTKTQAPQVRGGKCDWVSVKASWLGWGWGWRHPSGCSRWGSLDVRRRHCRCREASSASRAGNLSGDGRASSGGHCAWSACRTVGSRTSFPPCGCGSGGPAHQSGQTSYCSRAKCTGKAVLLQNIQASVYCQEIRTAVCCSPVFSGIMFT